MEARLKQELTTQELKPDPIDANTSVTWQVLWNSRAEWIEYARALRADASKAAEELAQAKAGESMQAGHLWKAYQSSGQCNAMTFSGWINWNIIERGKAEADLARERERQRTLEIPLSSGQVSIIDLEDFPLIAPHKWSATLDKDTGSYYAATYVRIDGKQIKFYMHRVIMGLERGDLRQVDHKEPSETLNNRRGNLRISTAQQNIANCRKQKNNKSGYKGVHWSKSEKKWIAQIHYNRANHTIGRFSTAEDANEAYIAEARRLHGEFARS